MLAVGGDPEPPLSGPGLVYEPKYDGIRALVEVARAETATVVRLWSRNGNDKAKSFPDIVQVLEAWAGTLDGTIVLDGEIVAVDAADRPQGFQRLQHRMHVSVPGYRSRAAILPPDEQAAAFIAFDLLRRGDDDLRARPLTARRAALEQLLRDTPPPSTILRLGEQAPDDGRGLYERAVAEGWEGLLVKTARSPYRDGKRSKEWRKLKLQNVDAFVITGWTPPQGTRARFGALILGRYDAPPDGSSEPVLHYAGDVGTGFSHDEIERVWTMLVPAETRTSPFATPPKKAGAAHWVTPSLVAQIRFTEMTDEGRLRHPAYLGLRDDRTAEDLRQEAGGGGTREARVSTATTKRPSMKKKTAAPRRATPSPRSRGGSGAGGGGNGEGFSPAHASIVEQLDALEESRKDGRLTLPDSDTLDVTNLHKVFWPDGRRTKGDLLRYYAQVAPLLLPVLDNRPLVMKRLPNGVDGKAFYQHRAPEPVPAGIRTETLPDDDVPARLVGGSLKTLLYMAQLASISMDPWFSTMDALDTADQVAIDLDPQPGATFTEILAVARAVHEVLEKVHVRGYPKTSGSEGLHIYIPLPPGTPYTSGMLFCQIVATMVATRYPKLATVERAVSRRRDGTIYVDYLQNIRGKTLACAYSARGSGFAGVSTPLTWPEVYEAPAPQDFTLATIMDRLASVGDLWRALREDPGADLLGAIEQLRP